MRAAAPTRLIPCVAVAGRVRCVYPHPFPWVYDPSTVSNRDFWLVTTELNLGYDTQRTAPNARGGTPARSPAGSGIPG